MLHSQINSIIVILLFGALIMLSFIHFANPLKVNKKGNRWFAVFLLLYASFWTEELVAFVGIAELSLGVVKILRIVQILTAVTLYFSVVFYAEPNFKFGLEQWWHSIIPIIQILLYTTPYFNDEIKQGFFIWGVITMLLQGLVYVALAFIKIKQHQQKILIYSSNTQGIELKWLEYIVIQVFVLLIIIVLHNIFISARNLNAFMNGIQLITAFVFAYFSWQQKEIYPVKEEKKEELLFVNAEEQPNPKRKLVEDNKLEDYKNNLNQLMVQDKPYLDSELNLVKLSELLQITSHQLSYVINTGFNENFFQFVNRYRVEKAKELLCNNEKLTMLAVAFDSGFNSKTAFNTTFKKITQQTPSEYKKSCTNL